MIKILSNIKSKIQILFQSNFSLSTMSDNGSEYDQYLHGSEDDFDHLIDIGYIAHINLFLFFILIYPLSTQGIASPHWDATQTVQMIVKKTIGKTPLPVKENLTVAIKRCVLGKYCYMFTRVTFVLGLVGPTDGAIVAQNLKPKIALEVQPPASMVIQTIHTVWISTTLLFIVTDKSQYWNINKFLYKYTYLYIYIYIFPYLYTTLLLLKCQILQLCVE